MAIHYCILVWRIPWTEELGGLQSMGRKESDILDPRIEPESPVSLALQADSSSHQKGLDEVWHIYERNTI